MPFIEIITDTKSQIELNKMMSGEIVNNCDIMYIKEKNIPFLFISGDLYENEYVKEKFFFIVFNNYNDR